MHALGHFAHFIFVWIIVPVIVFLIARWAWKKIKKNYAGEIIQIKNSLETMVKSHQENDNASSK